MNDRALSEATTPNNNLPTTTTRIVGRGEILEVVARDVTSSRLVSIVGAGGIGKTTVAIAAAEQVLESFADGVWLVDFAPLKEATLVPDAIAAAVGLVVHSADIMAALCRSLRDRATLLVLDNCEHLVETIAACVTRILAEAPGVHVLTTSRAPFRLEGELAHRLPGLSTPADTADLTAAEALTFPAIELFVERANDRLASFTLGDADAPIVADICKNLDGIALAIELAAMRVDVFGVRGLHKQLDDRFRLLGGRRAGLERHRTLAATLDWSYGLLPAPEASLLRAVSVFAGVFRLADASAIANVSPETGATMLGELAAQSLLSVDTDLGTKEGVYRPLETTRAYCLEKLVASGEERHVRGSHARYVCAVVEAAAAEHPRRPAREWGATYGRYLDDLRGALVWAGADPEERPLLLRLTAAGTVLWNHFSLTNESRAHLARAIRDLGDAAGTVVEMNLQLALSGAVLYTRGVVPEARDAVGRALTIAIDRNDAAYHLMCLRIIGTFELFSGENDAGLATLETFVTMAAKTDPSALAEGETHLGCAELFVGRLGEARARLERLYEAGLQDLDDANALRFLYNNSINVMIVLSHAQWLTGSPGAALQTGARLTEYAIKAGHELSLSIGLAWVCLVYFWAGRDDECSRHAAMLDDLVERHGIVTWRPIATFCRGALASMHEETRASGIAELDRTVAECRAIGHIARLPFFIAVLAEALARAGRLAEAEAKVGEALDLATKGNDNWSFPELLRIKAFVQHAQGKAAEHESTLQASMALAEKLGTTSWRLRTAIDLARAWRDQSRGADAKRMLAPIVATFTDGFETRDVAAARVLLAELGE